MNSENPAIVHAKFLARINNDFETAKIFFKGEDLTFDTDHIKYWYIRRGEETITIESGMRFFLVKRKTTVKDDTIKVDVFTSDYAKKYRDNDLLYFIDQGFGILKVLWKTDIPEDAVTRYFAVSEKLLEILGENKEELLMAANPKNLDAVVVSDILYSGLQSLLVKHKENPKVVSASVALMDEYEKIHKVDQHDNQKFELMLDGLEDIYKYI